MFWYGLLETFVKVHGHSGVTRFYETNDGYRLGNWVNAQRKYRDNMDPERQQRLEALPGWSWDVWADRWEEGFSHLKQFVEREGHCRVPLKYKTDDGYGLGQWNSNQRRAKDAMHVERGNGWRQSPAGRGIFYGTGGKRASLI